MPVAKVLAVAAVLAALFGPAPAFAQVEGDDAGLKLFAVHVNRTPRQSWPGYGVYLGAGLVLTAAHVPGNVADTHPRVVMADEDLATTLVRQGDLEHVDLTLLAVDPTKLPVNFQMRRMPLCGRAPFPGEAVVVATPEGTARSTVLPRLALPADLRDRFGTAIADVASTGNSGSGVFDAHQQCLLGIISRKITIVQTGVRSGAPFKTSRDIAKYFVPVGDIRAFIPADARF